MKKFLILLVVSLAFVGCSESEKKSVNVDSVQKEGLKLKDGEKLDTPVLTLPE